MYRPRPITDSEYGGTIRQQPKWSTGIFVAAEAVAALTVAGCGGSADSAEQSGSAQQQEPPDGTQNYADLEELHAAVIDAGVDCGPLDVAEGTGLASGPGQL